MEKNEGFYREAAAHLSAVKFAFRNPTMHIVKQLNGPCRFESGHRQFFPGNVTR
jgi:hypothetical protein